MRALKRPGSIAALAIIWIGSVNTPSHGQDIVGTFQGIATIETQQVVPGQPLGPPGFYTFVPASIGFTVTGGGIDFDKLQFDSNPLAFSINVNDTNISIVDGIPGQRAAQLDFGFNGFIDHGYYTSGELSLIDPSGEFIGPDGNGSPSDVQINSNFWYQSSNDNGIGVLYTVTFFTGTVPEPSSIVLATIAALVMSAVGLRRVRR